MTNLDYYLTVDHAARRRSTWIGLLIVVGVSLLLKRLGFSLLVTGVVAAILSCVVESIMMWLYRQPDQRSKDRECRG